MSSQLSSTIKTLAKVGAVVVIQIVLFTAIGIVLNLMLALFLWPEYNSLVPQHGTTASTTGGIAKAVGLLLFFLLLLPIIYFFIGKKQGIKAAISKIIHEKGDQVVYFIVSKFTDRMTENGEWKTSIGQNGVVKTVRKVFPGFIRTLNGLPWLLKRPLKIVFEGVDFAGAVENAYQTRPDAPINSPESNHHITQIVATNLKQKFPPPKGKLLLTLVIINLILFFLAKWLI